MPGGAKARLFVAVDPPVEVREELAAWARDTASALGLRGGRAAGRPLRLLEPHGLHLTLCFLGSRPVEEIEVIVAALNGREARISPLSLGAPLWLPPRRPRTLAVEVHDQGGWLAELQADVARAISRASGWQPERRRFAAHITVARLREGAVADRRSRGAPLRLPPTPQLRFTPEALILYRSQLHPAGAIYEEIGRGDLLDAER